MTDTRQYVIEKDNQHVATLPGTVNEAGIVLFQGGKPVINGGLAQQDGVLDHINRLAPQWKRIVRDYPAYCARVGDNGFGLVIRDTAAEAAAQAKTNEARAIAEWLATDGPARGNNRHPGQCDKCHHIVPAGYGKLERCEADHGCPQHMDHGGWHLTCANTEACSARAAKTRRDEIDAAMRRGEFALCGKNWDEDVVWRGDLRLPNDAIIAECRRLLDAVPGAPAITDADIIQQIESARRHTQRTQDRYI